MPSTKPILFGDEASPPVRFAMITAKLLGVDIHFHTIDLFRGDHKTEFFKKELDGLDIHMVVKSVFVSFCIPFYNFVYKLDSKVPINPLQKVPALLIDGHTICDSHAIALYLCRRSQPQDLYSADDMMKARVDQMLYFDATTLFPIDSAILSEYFCRKWPADGIKVNQWYSAVDYLETQLNINKWLAGDKMQLCDICCGVTLSSLSILYPPLERHVKVKEWLKTLDTEPCFEINRRGLERLRLFVKKYGPALDTIH